jgi:hypothetical protein
MTNYWRGLRRDERRRRRSTTATRPRWPWPAGPRAHEVAARATSRGPRWPHKLNAAGRTGTPSSADPDGLRARRANIMPSTARGEEERVGERKGASSPWHDGWGTDEDEASLNGERGEARACWAGTHDTTVAGRARR